MDHALPRNWEISDSKPPLGKDAAPEDNQSDSRRMMVGWVILDNPDDPGELTAISLL